MNMPDKGILTEDKWLSSMLGCDAYCINISQLNRTTFEHNLKALAEGKVFLYAKVHPGETEIIGFLEDVGFRLVDTNVRWHKKVQQIEPVTSYFTFRRALPEDCSQVTKLAFNSFKFSRFHQDPLIKDDTADRIKAAWAGNFFSGLRGNAMIIAESKGEISGFLQLDISKHQAVIDLIAVSETDRCKGVAKGMINLLEAEFEVKEVLVGTQLANAPSIRLYQKLRFQFDSAQYVFHYHSC